MGGSGVRVVVWPIDRDAEELRPEDLAPLLNRRTRIVAFPHVSNILGVTIDVSAISRMCHSIKARVVVDGVAYASHASLAVRAWDMDFYVYSAYKVYGPHIAAMFGKADAWAELTGPNHFFIPNDSLPKKFELGGACLEGCAGVVALGPYLDYLVGGPEPALPVRELPSRETVVAAFERMSALERPLTERLLGYLNACDEWRVIGKASANFGRVATVSFLHREAASPAVAAFADRRQIAIRSGNAYAYRLLRALDIDPIAGVVWREHGSLQHDRRGREIDLRPR